MTAFLPEGKLSRADRTDDRFSDIRALEKAMFEGRILEERALLCDSEHNLHLRLGGYKALIPRAEGAVGIREGTVRDIAILSRVNRPVQFVIDRIEIGERQEPLLILSRAKAQKKCIEEYIRHLTVGDIIDARVTHLEAFGAFCDIGAGVIALMPIDTISVSRIEHPDERFSVGMDIKAVIKFKENTRITLIHKELLGTWEENAAGFSVGETVAGVVRSVENYGVFVELTPNLAGLAELKENISVGHHASVFIKSIIPSKMKIKLVIIDSFYSDTEILPPKYYLSQGHIDRFVYSPDECEKYIYTDFSS